MTTTTVIFDLFGTLVAAPSPAARSSAAAALARAASTTPTIVEAYLRDSWMDRHDGSLPSVDALAAHLLASVGSSRPHAPVVETLRRLAAPRIEPDPSVVDTLLHLRAAGLKIGLISDASAEIADVWPAGRLAPLIDHAVFSCTANAVKPDASLYKVILRQLRAVPNGAVYVGDGGGDELRGAKTIGIDPILVSRRGGTHALAYRTGSEWQGPRLDRVEAINPARIHRLGQERGIVWQP